MLIKKHNKMKKTLLILGLSILALTTTMTSCNKSEPESGQSGNNGGGETITNSTSIGNNVYEINSAIFVVDDNENDVELKFNCNDLEINIELDGYDNIPTGTFELTREGKYTAEADMLFQDYDYEITGALTISESSDVITVTISGDAYKDRGPEKFSLTFQGEFENGGENGGGNGGGGELPTDNSILIDETSYPIKTAFYYVETEGFESEVTITFIGETNPSTIVEISLEGLNNLVPGTYNLTSEGLYQAEVETIMNDFDIIGELQVINNNNIYVVTIVGNAVDDGIIIPFALNYEGELSTPMSTY